MVIEVNLPTALPKVAMAMLADTFKAIESLGFSDEKTEKTEKTENTEKTEKTGKTEHTEGQKPKCIL